MTTLTILCIVCLELMEIALSADNYWTSGYTVPLLAYLAGSLVKATRGQSVRNTVAEL